MRFRVPVALVSLAAGVFGTGIAAADYSSEQAFISYTNSAREHDGLRSYAVRADLTATARRWAAWMAAHHTLAHNPSMGTQVCCWRDLGENVGRGGSALAIQRAFMASSEHRANILSRTFTQMGVGTARSSDGVLYVDELFRRPTSSYSTRVAGPTAAPAPRLPSTNAATTQRASHLSRSHVRAPRTVLRPSVTALLRQRIAWARHRVAPAAKADPVRRAFLYATAIRVVAG